MLFPISALAESVSLTGVCRTCMYVFGSLLQYAQVNGLYSVTEEQIREAGITYCSQNSFDDCQNFVNTNAGSMRERFRNNQTSNEGFCVFSGYCVCDAGTYFVNNSIGGICEFCPDGTYSNGMGEASCTSCPEPGITSSTYGKTSVFSCYIPKNDTFVDENGKWVYTEDCLFGI